MRGPWPLCSISLNATTVPGMQSYPPSPLHSTHPSPQFLSLSPPSHPILIPLPEPPVCDGSVNLHISLPYCPLLAPAPPPTSPPTHLNHQSAMEV